MATQLWTILKLVGPAATDAAARFDRWRRARRSTDPSSVGPRDWPAPVRRAASTYFARLLDHRTEMPIAYFSQHVDHWLAAGDLPHHLDDFKPHIWHDTGELWCYPLPERGRLVRRNAAAARSVKFPENKWLASRIIEAAQAYQKLWPKAVLLVNRQPITPSPSDDVLKAAAARMPRWLGRSATADSPRR